MRMKFTGVYIKKVKKYVGIFCLLLLLLVPMVVQSYRMAKQLSIDTFQTKLSQGLDGFETQILRANQITKILQQDEVFYNLLLLEAEPDSPDYPDFKKLQEELSIWSLTIDMMEDSYILYRKNDLYLSNRLSAVDYREVYPKYLQFGEQSVEDWRMSMFEENHYFRLLPTTSVYSSYHFPTNYQGIPLVINASHSRTSNSVLVFLFDQDKVMDSMLAEEEQNDCSLTLRYADSVIFSTAASAESEKAIRIDSTSAGGILEASLEIPETYFYGKLRSVINVLILYVAGGLALIVVLLGSLLLMESRRTGKMLRSVSQRTGLPFGSRNEYDFISNAMDMIYRTSEERQQSINRMTSHIRKTALENLLQFGVIPNDVSQEDSAYFQELLRSSCVIAAEISAEDTEEPLLHLKLFFAALQKDSAILVMGINQMTCIFPLEGDTLPDTLQQELEQYASQAKILRFGVSLPFSGAEQAHEAYRQARSALSYGEPQNRVVFYVPPEGIQSTFEISAQMRLHDALITGDSDSVQRIFLSLAPDNDSQREWEMLFYTLAHTIQNAWKELEREQLLKDTSGLVLPSFNQVLPLPDLLDSLRDFSLRLCALRNEQKNKKKSRHTEQVMHYIQEHFSDSDFSAETAAAGLSISANTVFAAVREETGRSFGNYVEELRLSRAEQLLLTTDLPGTRIWELCGFGSEKTFYRAFSKKHGVSPNQWKKAVKK